MNARIDFDDLAERLVRSYRELGASASNLLYKELIYLYDLDQWQARVLRHRFVEAMRQVVHHG